MVNIAISLSPREWQELSHDNLCVALRFLRFCYRHKMVYQQIMIEYNNFCIKSVLEKLSLMLYYVRNKQNRTFHLMHFIMET